MCRSCRSHWLHLHRLRLTVRGLRPAIFVAASLSIRLTSRIVNPSPPNSKSEVNSPAMKIAASDICFGPCCLAEIIAGRQDRGDPESDKYSGFLAGAYANPEP